MNVRAAVSNTAISHAVRSKMKTSQSFPLHAQVHTTDGNLGVLESVDTRPLGGGEDLLVVRSADGQLYHIPSNLVSRVKREHRPAVIVLSVRLNAMDAYLASPSVQTPPSEKGRGAEILRIPLLAETLVVRKQPVQWGSLHMHKGVESNSETRQVSVFHEEAIIERLSIEAYEREAPVGIDEFLVPIYEEQVVTGKRTVLKEYVLIRKRMVEEEQTVRDTIRREHVDVREVPPT